MRLIRLGVPAGFSQLVAVGAQLIVPVLILHALGEHEVGLYRAASTISIAYLTLALSTLSYEYMPRITRLPSHELGPAIDRYMRVLLGGALPAILGLFAGGPLVIELLFSDEFSAAISVLQWQLVGDLLRLPAWALAFALLARSQGGLYLGLEAIAGAALIVAVPVGLQLGGLEGVGVGYAVAQGVYLVVAWEITSRVGITTPGRLQVLVLVSALSATASIVLGVPLLVRAAVFSLVALALAAISVPRLYAMHRAGEI
jgi:O-antigen/teichoic acid export membrane protein